MRDIGACTILEPKISIGISYGELMRLGQLALGIGVAAALVFGGAAAWSWRPEIPPAPNQVRAAYERGLVTRGGELSSIGNCNVCHTSGRNEAFAGGRAINTPFGTIFSSNITPDVDTGIGDWTEEAFGRAMHEGVDRQGRQLYPAFPYDHFTEATDDDVHAIYAFLMTLSPVRKVVPPNELIFPLNFRPVVAAWKMLFLRRGNVSFDNAKDPEWNRGRYLVEGLGHCGACHTPRNVLGAEEKYRAFSGGSAEDWDAPALNSLSVASETWTADQLLQYLSTGWHERHGAAAGPMAEVTANLARASKSDVQAIAAYISSLSAKEPRPDVAQRRVPAAQGETSVTAAIYNGACANCHESADTPGPSKAISLGFSTVLRQARPGNAIRVVLHGIQPTDGSPGAFMPSFDGALTQSQIASLVSYLRARYTAAPEWERVEQEVAKAKRGSQP